MEGQQEIQFQRLLDIKRTQLQMVLDRGYTISPQEQPILDVFENETGQTDYKVSAQQFYNYLLQRSRENVGKSEYDLLTNTYPKYKEGKFIGAILVYYVKKENKKRKISVDSIRDFIAAITKGLLDQGVYIKFIEGILICDAPLSSDASKMLKDLIDPRWQSFFESELTYNVTLREEVPIHQLLTPEQKEMKLRQLGVDSTQLPYIELSDPVVKYYGWPVGGLVRVIRDDSYIGILGSRSINYRTIIQ